MRHFSLGLILSLSALLAPASRADADDAVLELRIYTCEEGKLPALHERFREHTTKLFAKHGMENVAYWTPTDGPEADTTLIYLLRHDSLDAAKTSWDGFRNDPEWKQVAAASAEKHGKILAKAPESIYLKPTDYSPKKVGTDPSKTYELRIYTANDGKLDALHSRSRDHTIEIFDRHGMASYGYWTNAQADDNRLYYVLEYDSRDQAKAAWKAFLADPDWKAAFAASTKDGRLVREVDSTYMRPVDYSPVRETK